MANPAESKQQPPRNEKITGGSGMTRSSDMGGSNPMSASASTPSSSTSMMGDMQKDQPRQSQGESQSWSTDEMTNQAREYMDQFSAKAGEYYEDATQWLSQNYGKALMAVGVLAAAGMVGYFIARGSKRTEEFLDRTGS